MPSRRDKKWVILSAFEGISPLTRHYSKLGTISQLPQRRAIRISHYDVVNYFNLEQLSGPDEIPRHLDVGFRWCGITRWVIVHQCDVKLFE